MTKIKRILTLIICVAILASATVIGTSTASASGSGAGLVSWAYRAYNEHWKYVWGGASVGSVDCSGLIYSYAGGERVTESMIAASPESGSISSIPRIHGLGLYQYGHVGVYVGGGMGIDARDEISNVCLDSISNKSWTQWFKISGVSYPTSGWQEVAGQYYYYEDGQYIVNTSRTIDGVTYTFSSTGVCQGEKKDDPSPNGNTGNKTIKNYLAGALLPVGKALYVWGGGWNDSTRKGLSDTMTSWYNKWSANPSSYDYNNYRDLSTSNRAKGFDCSGFVGWSAYQVMQTQSGVGYGYTVVSGEIGSYYKGKGWGSIVNQSYLSQNGWELKPGDIGYNDGHTWIVLGQCSDKSVVIIHSTPQAGVQISGTTTPTGSYSSEAAALAKKYMSLYSGYSIFNYHPSVGNYIRNGNYLRWNGDTLSDPDGYYNMTADQILYDLFGK